MNSMRYHTTRLQRDEHGFASLVVGLVLIVVLALITIGFAQLSRNEQQSALTKELSSQAYYAAESGVNDILNEIKSGTISQAALETPGISNTCFPFTDSMYNPDIDSVDGVSYTCALINNEPPSIVYGAVDPDGSNNITFSTSAALGSLTINWGSADGHTTAREEGGFTPVANWTANGVATAPASPAALQFTVTPLVTDGAGHLTRANLQADSYTVYLYPKNGTNSTTYTTAASGQAPIIDGDCDLGGEYPCQAQITGLNGAANESYLIHFINYYDSSNISITANSTDADGGGPINFINGQADIDVTGRAHNVLKRIDVRAPLSNTTNLPAYAVEGQAICKEFYLNNDEPATVPAGSPCPVSN